MDARLELIDFVDFNRCLLVGYSSGIRWTAAMEAYEHARNYREPVVSSIEFLDGSVPYRAGGEIGESSLRWNYCSTLGQQLKNILDRQVASVKEITNE